MSGISSIALEDKRGYLTLVLTTSFPQEGKLLLRKTEGLKDMIVLFVAARGKDKRNQIFQLSSSGTGSSCQNPVALKTGSQPEILLVRSLYYLFLGNHQQYQ